MLWAGNFHDQGGLVSQVAVNDKRGIFDGDLAAKSFDDVAEQAPNADAYLINGMCNFRSGPDGVPERPLQLTPMLEERLGKPVIRTYTRPQLGDFTHTRAHACMHGRTNARMHACTHTNTNACTDALSNPFACSFAPFGACYCFFSSLHQATTDPSK